MRRFNCWKNVRYLFFSRVQFMRFLLQSQSVYSLFGWLRWLTVFSFLLVPLSVRCNCVSFFIADIALKCGAMCAAQTHTHTLSKPITMEQVKR